MLHYRVEKRVPHISPVDALGLQLVHAGRNPFWRKDGEQQERG